MAYPTVSAPYGLKPVNLIGGQAYAGSTRMYPVPAANGTAIYTGDVVILQTDGTVTKATATDTATLIVGVFMGCSYTNATSGQKQFAQYCPATPPADTVAYIVDDPDVVFKIAVTTASGTTISARTRDCVGSRAAFNLAAGSTATGNSSHALNSATDTTATLPLKIIDVVTETVNASGSSTEVLVIFNPGSHFMRNTVGV